MSSYVCCVGFLATLLLSLPLLATHSNNTVDVGTQVDPTPEDSITRKCVSVCLSVCVHVMHCTNVLITEMKHQAHVSLEQRILAFERESEERTRKMMEERVFDRDYIYTYSIPHVCTKVSQFKATELLRVKMETKEMLQKEFQRKRNEVRYTTCVLVLQHASIFGIR